MPRFELFFKRDPYDGLACVDYALIPEGMRRTLELPPGKKSGCRADDAGRDPITHVNFFQIANGGYGLSKPWQIPPGPPAGELVSATVEVRGDMAYAAVRFGPPSNECSRTYTCKLDLGEYRCELTDPGGPCEGKPCEIKIETK